MMFLRKSLGLFLCCFSFLSSFPAFAMEEDFSNTLLSKSPFGFDPEIMGICESLQRTQARCHAFIAITQRLNLGLQGLSGNDSRILAARKVGQLLSRQDRIHFENPTFCETAGITNPNYYIALCEAADQLERFRSVDIELLREYLDSATDQQGVCLYEQLFELAGRQFFLPDHTPANMTALFGSLTIEEDDG